MQVPAPADAGWSPLHATDCTKLRGRRCTSFGERSKKAGQGVAGLPSSAMRTRETASACRTIATSRHAPTPRHAPRLEGARSVPGAPRSSSTRRPALVCRPHGSERPPCGTARRAGSHPSSDRANATTELVDRRCEGRDLAPRSHDQPSHPRVAPTRQPALRDARTDPHVSVATASASGMALGPWRGGRSMGVAHARLGRHDCGGGQASTPGSHRRRRRGSDAPRHHNRLRDQAGSALDRPIGSRLGDRVRRGAGWPARHLWLRRLAGRDAAPASQPPTLLSRPMPPATTRSSTATFPSATLLPPL